eukprot:TRINITY_DN5881_c0_g1_i9.p1 TRINITY_DN5881_c0_g1~~TRINITY_DN5881_c0_g1_i9.p1  ORF type:complete len:563 (-),score=129.56 TRINITY_DN5881_c0_g1_i9:884-2572(-)
MNKAKSLKQTKSWTEREIQEEFEGFFETLADIETDWSKRLEALKRLQEMIHNGAYQKENFIPLLTKLTPQISTQLNDLRSAIPKEASQLICLAAKVCGDRIEGITDRLVTKESLLRIINSANKIIAEYGHKCILELLESSATPKVIPRVIEEMANKNQGVRMRVSQYITKFFEVFSEGILEKYILLFENVALAGGLADAAQEVRMNSRRSYLIYEKLFPDRAVEFFRRLDAPIQKAITEERQNGVPETKKPLKRKKQVYESSDNILKQSNNQLPMKKKADAITFAKQEVLEERPKVQPSKIAMRNSAAYPSYEKLQENMEKENVPDDEEFTLTLKEDDLAFLIEKAGNENWAIRMNSFEQINEIVSTLRVSAEFEKLNMSVLGKLLQIHIEHLNDSHFKVILSCIDSLGNIIEWDTRDIPAKLSFIIPKLLNNVDSNNDKVQLHSKKLLELIERKLDWSLILRETLRAHDISSKSKIIICAFDYILHLLEEVRTGLPSSELVRLIVKDIGKKIIEINGNKYAIQTGFSIIQLLVELDRQNAIQSLLSLSPSLITQVKFVPLT